MNGLPIWMVAAAAFLMISIAVIGLTRLRGKADAATRWPLYAKQLLREREQVLYWRLVSTFPNHVVLAQVALSQLLGVEKGTKNRQALANRFHQLCADFVICERSFKPVVVVELDGSSHDHPRRADADARKAIALESAGLVLLRVNAASMPDVANLRKQLPMLSPVAASP